MRTRKEHVITKIRGDGQPSRLIGLSVRAQASVELDGLGWQRETFLSWSSCGWERKADGSYRSWSVTNGDVDRWWRAVMWGAKRPGVTWVVAMRAVRVASILSLWRLLDERKLQWDGERVQPPGVPGDGSHVRPVRRGDLAPDADVRRAAPDGVPPLPPPLPPRGSPHDHAPFRPPVAPSAVALDDPPTVLRLRVPGLPGRLLLLDARNWGLSPPEQLADTPAEAEWIASAMRRMADALVARGWGAMKCTAGSQAMATWRRSFMTHKVTAHADADILDLERRAYVGGRCECGRLGEVKGPLYFCDRSGAYAAACFDLSVPCRVRGRRDGDLESLVRDPELAGRCLAEAGVEGSEPAYPYPSRDGVRYPVGRRSCVLAGPELRDAVERGALVRLGRCVEYDCAPALRAYAGALWQARQEFGACGDDALKGWVKKVLVCLPGKLGQRAFEWSACPEITPPAPWFSWWGITREREVFRLRSLGGAVQRQSKGDWCYDSVPAAACFVLSEGRRQLLRAIRVCGWGHCLYWDTDSLLLDQHGYDLLRSSPGLFGDGLGQWRLVRQVRVARLYGPKYYDHDGAVTCAGLPQSDCSRSALRDRFWYRQTFGSALLEGHEPQAGRKLRHYTRAPKYTLGRVGPGGRVHPHVRRDW